MPAFPSVSSGGVQARAGRRPAPRPEDTGFDAEAAGGTPTSWMTKLPALVPVLVRVSVRSCIGAGSDEGLERTRRGVQ